MTESSKRLIFGSVALIAAVLVLATIFPWESVRPDRNNQDSMEALRNGTASSDMDLKLAEPQDNTNAVENTSDHVSITRTAEFNLLLQDVDPAQVDQGALEEMLTTRNYDAYRIVSVNGDALREKVRNYENDSVIEIRLFDDELYSLVAIKAEEYHSGWKSGMATWRGSVSGDETAKATFVVSPDGTVDGVIRSPKLGRIKLEQLPDTGYYLLWRLGPGEIEFE